MKRESTIELTQDHLNLLHSAAKELSRPILATLYIDAGYVVGCDGYKLARMPLETPEDFEPYAIPMELLKEIKLPKGKALTVERSELELTLSYVDSFQSNRTVSGKVREGTYPDYKQLLNLKGEPKGQIALSARILKELLASLPKASSKTENVILKLFPRDVSSSVAFQVTVGITGDGVGIEKMNGMIMPVFVKWDAPAKGE